VKIRLKVRTRGSVMLLATAQAGKQIVRSMKGRRYSRRRSGGRVSDEALVPVELVVMVCLGWN
jgi:hypothetical protein